MGLMVEILLGIVSNCGGLVGVFTGDGEVGLVKKYNIRVHRLCVRALHAQDRRL